MKKIILVLIGALAVSAVVVSAIKTYSTDEEATATSSLSEGALIALDKEHRYEDIAFSYPSSFSAEEYGRSAGGVIVLSDGSMTGGSSMSLLFPIQENLNQLKDDYNPSDLGENLHQGVTVPFTTDQGLSGYKISYDNDLGETKGYAYLIQAPRTRLVALHSKGKYDGLFERIVNSLQK